MTLCTGDIDIVADVADSGADVTGSSDNRWRVANTTGGGTMIAATKGTQPGTHLTPEPGTGWIGIATDLTGWGDGTRKFDSRVTLTGSGSHLAMYNPTGYCTSDWGITEARMNGVVIPGLTTPAGGYDTPISFNIPGSMMIIGDNLLEVEEVDAAEMERYLALVKAKPQLKRYSREQLARYLATRPPAEPEPPSEPHQMRESIEKKLLAAAKGIKHCGDYGTLYYHPVKQQVHWTAGDADGPPDYTPPDEIQKLLKLPGIKHVEIGDEWSPKDEGWKRLTEDEEPEPDPRSEMDRLLPTTQSRLRGNSMIHAPGVINLAQMRWRERSKAAKKNGMDIIKAWQGLPEERYLRILNNDRITIETDGDDAIITFRDY
jgi:hypothetical protein